MNRILSIDDIRNRGISVGDCAEITLDDGCLAYARRDIIVNPEWQGRREFRWENPLTGFWESVTLPVTEIDTFFIYYAGNGNNSNRGPFYDEKQAREVFDNAPIMPGMVAYLEKNGAEIDRAYGPEIEE